MRIMFSSRGFEDSFLLIGHTKFGIDVGLRLFISSHSFACVCPFSIASLRLSVKKIIPRFKLGFGSKQWIPKSEAFDNRSRIHFLLHNFNVEYNSTNTFLANIIKFKSLYSKHDKVVRYLQWKTLPKVSIHIPVDRYHLPQNSSMNIVQAYIFPLLAFVVQLGILQIWIKKRKISLRVEYILVWKIWTI